MIVKHPHPALTTLCADIKDPSSEENVALAERLFEWMEKGDEKGPGRGLAAPQLGVCVKMFVMWSFPMPFVNPVVEWKSRETSVMSEGCLSIPFVTVSIERSTSIRLRAQSITGTWKTWKLRGLDARVALHELDHLDGVLILDHALAEDQDAA